MSNVNILSYHSKIIEQSKLILQEEVDTSRLVKFGNSLLVQHRTLDVQR